MNEQTTTKFSPGHSAYASGTTLLEVLLAIVIFVVGMLALASLQGNLTRSSSDSNMRTVAANIAEETIEGMRAFEVIASEAGKIAYEDIEDSTRTEQRGGVDYTITVDVDDYYFLADRVSVSKTPPSGVTASSFKHVDLAVTWNSGVEFQVDEDTSTSGRLGSGSITVASIIPSIPSLNNAKVAAEDDGALGYPPVNYTPGLNPDIVAISLGDQKFKESTTPAPIVRRADELVETWFDVITYTTITTDDGEESTFLRREEFASISCECELQAPEGDAGRQPTLWTGAEYAEGELAEKQYGVSATNQQSQYCDVCCRDHHDTSSGNESYRPLADSFTGDHPHYSRSNKGVLTEANVGDDYVEACRLVRKDGFFRVAQDFMLQSQTAFPEDYLDEGGEVTDYSEYVTDAVENHFEVGGAWPAHGLEFDGRDFDHPTNLPTTWTDDDSSNQQLRSRGIYTDVVSTALQDNLDNCFNDDGTPKEPPDNNDCEVTNVTSPLEIYPFFDVQLTLLARWTDSNEGDPFVVSNDELETDNTHSRGLASLAGSMVGQAYANSNIETGNVGLISIAEIAEVPPAEYSDSDLWISADGGTEPPPTGNAVVSGTLVAAGDTTKLVPSVEGGGGATCTRPDNNTFSCVVPLGSLDPTLTVSNYYTKNKTLIACAPGLTMISYNHGNNKSNTWTQFALPVGNTEGIEITISFADEC